MQNDMSVVLRAGKLLIESGAEVYRVEDTMKHFAKALQIENFEAYVVSSSIIASGINRYGKQEAKVCNTDGVTANLGRLEAVNNLSRQIAKQDLVSPEEIVKQLDLIEHQKDYSLLVTLISYFCGAGSFSLALGSSLLDSFSAAVTGLILGYFLNFMESRIHTGFLLTILGSSVVALSANLLYFSGLGEHRSIIILGALMVMVPGAAFVNSVREFSQNNFSTGLALIMSALLICISISAGVAITIEIIPFAEQMTGSFSGVPNTILEIIIRTLMAGLGTIAFSILYHVPKRYFLDLGILGAISWMLYLILWQQFHMDAIAVFFPGLFITYFSRLLAAKRKCPATVFLATSMFPLIPGLSFYRAVYFLLTGADAVAMEYFRSCFVTAFTIAIAISIVQQIPLSFFIRRKMIK
ncbi:threonine/serine exporter family protein [Streptococcus agalactiae]|uniref:threonine/serine ThrE exporter family protein n=1 Tax=Streptococcus agalactiae TaxID=1311 RepID=UPI0005E305E9|nr:threonine/serine exporter family protein [Streptococcus agalactiae]CNK35188.1 membrane protein [Streptococcus agalactiae]